MRQFLSLSFAGLVFLSPFAHADDLGERRQYESLTFYAQTTDSSGGEANASSAPICRVYQEGAFLFQNTMTQLDSSNTSGFYSATIQLTPANAFDRGKHHAIRIRGTVSSVNKPILHTFRIHPNEVLVQHDGNNSTSGATAESRIEASTAGTVVILSPGVFDMGTAELAIPDGVSVRGAGMDATRIKSSITARFVIPGDRSVVEHLTIEASVDGGRPFGAGDNQQFDNAVLRDARLIGDDDCAHIVGTSASSLTIERVWMFTAFDGIVTSNAAHKLWLRDVFIVGEADGAFSQGIVITDTTHLYGTGVNVDISDAPGAGGHKHNRKCNPRAV